MKKLVVFLLIALCVGGLWAAPGQQSSKSTATGNVAFLDDSVGLKNGAFFENVPRPSKNYQIANITRTLMNAHWIKEKEGFEAAAKQYGVTGQTFAVQSEADVMDQANILDTIIERKFDAIAVSPITEQNLLAGLARATAAGIVIINIDTAEIVPASARANNITITSFIGSDNYYAGGVAADYISQTLGSKKGKVAVIEGMPGDTCAIARTTGFADKVKTLPNLTLVASQTARWDRLEALNVTTSVLRANPDIMGIYCNNDTMVLGAMQAAADLGYTILTSDNLNRAGEAKTLVLIGNDGIQEALDSVQTGALTGTIAQKPYLMGYAAIEAAITTLEGGTPTARIATPIMLVTKKDYK
ncbi:MAG: substrate-binding domain-containing protein [Treponema sp.]|jgi:ABC-type sugar transport system substrate-binding protein|nr:substrate-binding domain-containing protein [Treponema sp.]